MNKLYLSGSLLLAANVLSSTAHAQAARGDALEEIIITAEKRESNIQRTSASVSAVSGNDILMQGVTQLDDALKNLPGVVVSQGPTGLNPSIRGVGPNLPANIGGSSGVSTTFDGVYDNADISSRLGFYDLARIEVLRGPQGTLYGRNAEGGVVATVTNNPVNEFAGSGSIELGNYSLMHYTAMVNVPVTDHWAVRVAGGSIDRKGYLSNGQDDNRAQGVRIKSLYKPNEAVSWLIGLEQTRVSGEGPGTVTAFTTAPSPSVAYSNTRPTAQIYEVHGYKAWSQLDVNLGFGALTVIPAYQYLSEPKQLQLTGLTNAHSDGKGALIQRSAEVRLASNESSPFSWLVGYFTYSNGNSRNTIATVLSGTTIIDSTTAARNIISDGEKSSGLFGQVTVPLNDQWRVIAGLRRSKDEKRRTNYSNSNPLLTGVSYKGDWSHTDWKGGVEFNVAPDSLLYATVASGYRPGGFSPAPANAADPDPKFDLESLRTYEVGSKNEFFNKSLRVNASVYVSKYEGYQFSNLVPRTGGGFDLSIVNLPSVKIRGVELETQWAASRADLLSLAVNYLKTEVDSPAFIALPPPGVQLQGQALPYSPKLSANLSYEHRFVFANGARLAPSVTVRHVDDLYVTIPDNANTHQDAYQQWDASVTFTPADAKWSSNVYVKNASYEVVKSNFIGNNMTLQSPRTYGIVFNARF